MASAEAELLRVAREIATADPLDVAAALAFLNTLPDALDPALYDAVVHAKSAVAIAPGGDHRHTAIARYMMAQVVALLDRSIRAGGLSRPT